MKAKSSKTKTHKKRGVSEKEPILKEASFKQLSYIDILLEKANIPQREYNMLYQKSKRNLSEGEAEDLINYLLDNQVCYILSGFNYSKTDIVKKLNDMKW